jgi:hypothetical protein
MKRINREGSRTLGVAAITVNGLPAGARQVVLAIPREGPLTAMPSSPFNSDPEEELREERDVR